MASTEVIEIAHSNSPIMAPKLSVTGNIEGGTIKLKNLPPLETVGAPISERKSVNFGPGADLFMNQGRNSKSNSPKSDINLNELKSLDLLEASSAPKKSLSAARNVMLNSPVTPAGSETIEPTIKLNIGSPTKNASPTNKPNLGNLDESKNKNETWDGYKKFNNIPVNPVTEVPEKPKMSAEQILKEKFNYIRRLEALDKKGVSISKKYTMEDSLDEMKGEYEMIKSEQQKKNSVKFQGKMLMAFVSGIEFLNSKFDPFDIKLDGWGESVNENLEEYDDVFGELHEKYGGKAKMAPELKLLFMLGGSAGMIHMTNTMFKSAMPGMDDIMRQNPELMQQFTQAAVNTMGQKNPGFGNFMGSMMPPMGSPPGPPMAMNVPPNRPDISMARGGSRAEFKDSVNMEDQYGRVNPNTRREMKGPSDINEILSGIKTKKVNIKKSSDGSGSTISVSDLKELQQTNLDIPRKSKRKPKSERNTVNLDL